MSRSYNTIHAKKWQTGPSSMKRDYQKRSARKIRASKNLTHDVKFANMDWDNYVVPIQKRKIWQTYYW